MNTVLSVTAGYCLARVFDQGLADYMGLATLRLGTDPVNWGKIHLSGTEPHSYYGNSCDNYGFDFTFVWEQLNDRFQIVETWDRQKAATVAHLPPLLVTIIEKVSEYALYVLTVSRIKNLLAQTIPYLYSTGPVQMIAQRVFMYGFPIVQKGIASWKRVDPLANKWTAPFKIGLLPLMIFCTPTVKVRVPVAEFDDSFKEIYPLTARVILVNKSGVSAAHIGFRGTLKGCSEARHPPIFTSPIKVAKGACLLAGACAAGYAAYTFFPEVIVAHQVAIVVGMIFAAL